MPKMVAKEEKEEKTFVKGMSRREDSFLLSDH
jgi:hypothetical protein